MPNLLRSLLLAILLPIAAGMAPAGDEGHLRASDLRCEYRRDPIAIGEPRPRLSWIVESDRRAERQTAYRVLVASSPERLAGNEGDLWDSGRVESRATTHIEYAGAALTSRRACWWKVRSWDRDGEAGPWSEPARWDMGLLEPSDWSARWIDAAARPAAVTIERAAYYTVGGDVRKDVTEIVAASVARGEPVVASNEALGGDPAYGVLKRLEIVYTCDGTRLTTDVVENATAPLARERLPYLRKRFGVDRPIARARLHATALGVYNVHLNGERIGDDELAPGWTDYRERVRYQVHDVTGLLQRGENVLGAVIAPGWFAGRAGLFHARAYYGDAPALLAQLEITYEDGGVERIVTDETWRRHDGPILIADIMDGEIHDAIAEIDGWCAPGASDDGWEPVTIRDETRNLVTEIDAPVRVLEELPAVAVTEPAPGRWVFDLAQNMVGVAKIRVDEPEGTVLTIRHAEMLNPDGTLYTANLRGSAATDTYVCKGGGETWRPRFTFHGFRYVEVTGLTGEPGLETVMGVVLGSDLERTGTFECSDERLNQLQSNIVWGMRGNYLSIPTDCPQRDERMGWTGDAQVFAPTAAFNANIAPFMTKWMIDLTDAQREDGAHADVAPVMDGLNYGTPAWGDAGTIVPWAVYQAYGDRRILDRSIDSMKRWVEYCRVNSTGLIRDRGRGNDYGDWLSINADTPKELIGTAYFAHSTDILARSLRALGRDAEAQSYELLFRRIREAFIERYVEDDGTINGDTQTCYALALRFGLLPGELRDEALEHLIEDLRSRGWRLSTGFVGVSHLLHVLDEGGRPDAAYRLLMQDAFPSWLFSVRHGATTIWERWNGWTPGGGMNDPGMNSFNHYALGSCGEWLFRGVAGIEPTAAHPGFEHFLIAPRIDGPLAWARASFDSMHGTIESCWRLDGERLELDVTIPANTSAGVIIPAGRGTTVLESGSGAANAEGIQFASRDVDHALLLVGSGEYRFTSTPPAPRTGNPVFPGWYADPEVAVFGDRYWIFPTYSATYDEQLHFDAFSSPDLVRWTKHERVLDSEAIDWAWRAMWAPSVIERDGRYFFFFGANDIQSDEEPGGIGVAVADAPKGPYKDHLGEPLIDAFHNGAQPIDQFVFRDTDGQDYLIYGGWQHCNIAKLNDDYTGFVPFEDGSTFKEITPDGYVEGPTMFIRDDKYYFMWSEGGWTGPDYSVAYATADSPLGPFERIGKILKQDPEIATGAGHHSVLKVPGRDEYYIVYHRRPIGESDRNHRVVCIDRMNFDEDGRIEPVRITFEGVGPVPRPGE